MRHKPAIINGIIATIKTKKIRLVFPDATDGVGVTVANTTSVDAIANEVDKVPFLWQENNMVYYKLQAVWEVNKMQNYKQ